MELREFKGVLLGYMREEGIVFHQEGDGRMKGVSYSKLSLDPAHPSVVVCGQFDDPYWELVTIAHEVGHILNFREMGRNEARDFFCTVVAATSLGLERLSWGGQRFMLFAEALASLKGLQVLRVIGIPEEGLADMRGMMIKLFETYCRKCERSVVDEVLKQAGVMELVG
ncbi:MAG: hypothetical protein JSW32_02025 [Deltaproteobacteria bacterium]|nr:MAG: hypothetical protein JSW32_02025 [Deltaproteobacteria bacterium]